MMLKTKLRNFLEKKLWSNPNISEPSLTIWPEQGIGDFILYSRFFGDLNQIEMILQF